MHRGFGTVRLLVAIVTVAFAFGAMLGPLCVLIGSCSMPCCHATTSPSASLASANNCGSTCSAQTSEPQPGTAAVAPEQKASPAPLLVAAVPASGQALLPDNCREVLPDGIAALPHSSQPLLYVINSSFLI